MWLIIYYCMSGPCVCVWEYLWVQLRAVCFNLLMQDVVGRYLLFYIRQVWAVFLPLDLLLDHTHTHRETVPVDTCSGIVRGIGSSMRKINKHEFLTCLATSTWAQLTCGERSSSRFCLYRSRYLLQLCDQRSWRCLTLQGEREHPLIHLK